MRTSKLHAVLAAVAVVGIACPGPDDLSVPVSSWDAVLLGANEVPAVTSPGVATGTFSLNATGDSLNFSVNVTTALTGTITQAHIHTGNIGANGGVAIWLCNVSGTNPPAGTAACLFSAPGTGALVTGKAPISAAQLNSMRTYATYANIHSNASTAALNGEIRGQVRNIGTVE